MINIDRSIPAPQYALPTVNPREFLQDVMLYLNRDDNTVMPSLDDKYVTVETTQKAECALVRNFISFLAHELPEKYSEQKMRLQEFITFGKVYECVDLLSIKYSLISLRNKIALVLTDVESSDLKSLEEKSTNIAQPKSFDILLELTRAKINPLRDPHLIDVCTEKLLKQNDLTTIIDMLLGRYTGYFASKTRLLEEILKKCTFEQACGILKKIHFTQLKNVMCEFLAHFYLQKDDPESAYQITQQLPKSNQFNQLYIAIWKAYIKKGEVAKVLDKAKFSNHPFAQFRSDIFNSLLRLGYLQEASDFHPFLGDKLNKWGEKMIREAREKKTVQRVDETRQEQTDFEEAQQETDKSDLIELLYRIKTHPLFVDQYDAAQEYVNDIIRNKKIAKHIKLFKALPEPDRLFFYRTIAEDYAANSNFKTAFSLSFNIPNYNSRMDCRSEICLALILKNQFEEALTLAATIAAQEEKSWLFAKMALHLAYRNSIEPAEKLLEKLPASHDGRVNLVIREAYECISRTYLNVRKDLEKSLAVANYPILDSTTKNSCYYSICGFLIKEKQYDAALEIALKMENGSPLRGRALENLLYSYKEVKNYGKVLETLLVYPRDQQTHFIWWANWLIERKQNAEAYVVIQNIQDKIKAIELMNTMGEVWMKEKIK